MTAFSSAAKINFAAEEHCAIAAQAVTASMAAFWPQGHSLAGGRTN